MTPTGDRTASTAATGPVLSGLHHVTAITANAQANIDFYCGVLGLRLVKLTVNFDDPGSFHLYYGDELGRPGTVLTFFEWPDSPRGRIGPPQVTATAFAVPAASLDYWSLRLQERKVDVGPLTERLGERVLQFTDPDGLAVELVGVAREVGIPWPAGPVPGEHALRGFHSVTLSEEGYELTAEALTGLMGFIAGGQEGSRFRYRAGGNGGDSGFASTVDVVCAPDARHGLSGGGVVHHVAFRTPDPANQAQWRERIVKAFLNVSPVIDRTYFRSIYYREPGGVLFEIATEGPGFEVDESAAALGSGLMLPAEYEFMRPEIEARWRRLRLPRASGQGAGG